MSDEKPKNTVLDLFNLPDKKAVQKFCRDATITDDELAEVILAASVDGLGPFKYARYHVEVRPEHLEPNEADLGKIGTPEGAKTMRKVSQIFKQRRQFGAHLFYLPNKARWHLVYFDQRDMDRAENHWKEGSHIHYSRESYVNEPLDAVWVRITTESPQPPKSEHIRYIETRERGFIGPGDSG